MAFTVLTIGFHRHEAQLHALCRQLGCSIAGAVPTAKAALDLLPELPVAAGLVLANANADGVDVTDLALALSRMPCKPGLIVCGIACPRTQDSLLILLSSLGLRAACTAGAPPDFPALCNAVREAGVRERQAMLRTEDAAAPLFDADEIRGALARNQFELHYQPKLRLADGSLCGVEALLRWRHPQHGVLTPASFLHQAEAAGLADVLTSRVMQLAVADARTWHTMGNRMSISINLSPLALANPCLAERILELARHSQLAPAQWMFEITEYTEIADLSTALRNLLKLRLHGHRLSLDDYGAGHGSILQLSRIPFDELKADMRLVQGAWKRPHLKPLLRQAVTAAHDMGIICVAEGIETQEDWDYVRSLGFDLGQGYLIAAPMPASQILDWGSGQAAAA